MYKKIAATILIIAVVLTFNFNLFLITQKKAEAADLGGSWAQAIKDMVLDAVGWTLTDIVLNGLERKIMAWGQGRTSSSMESLRIMDFAKYFKNAMAVGAAKYINDFKRTEIDPRIKDALVNAGFTRAYNDLAGYQQYAKSTLKTDLGDNYQAFVDSNYSLSVGGWQGWFSMIKPQNNIFGQALMAQQERQRREQEEKEAAQQRSLVAKGYKNETITTQTDTGSCINGCELDYPKEITTYPDGTVPNPEYEQCIAQCETQTTGLAIGNKIKNLGQDIEKQMTDAMGKDMQRIISADEITELIGVIFSSLINRAVHEGLSLFESVTSKAEKNRMERRGDYSYYEEFKEDQTLEDREDVRSKILSGILKGIQQLSRSVIPANCEKKEMMKYADYSKNLADILESYVEGLYVGLEGANLKPDFNVLDGRFAPYSVYGYSFSDIPSSKFPSKCQDVVISEPLNLSENSTCIDIVSGLEPDNYIDSRCSNCIYDHGVLNCPPAPYPPQDYGDEWNRGQIEQKQEFYSACKSPYNAVLNRCDKCLENADKKCNQANKEDKNKCIIEQCDIYHNFTNNALENYIENIVTDPIDFHNRCLIEEKKEHCYTCLKEYFMPATYCEQAKDYIARSIVKYPALVNKVRSGLAIDHAIWIGPYDEVFGEIKGGHCDDNKEAEDIRVDLICRIMPDFRYEGEEICRTRCFGSTISDEEEEMLKDITDFRPNQNDCLTPFGSISKIDIGGKEPFAPINDGEFHIRGKCCAAFHQHDEDKYAWCVGSGASTEQEEPEPTLTFQCLDGQEGRPDEGEVTFDVNSNAMLSPSERQHSFIAFHRQEGGAPSSDIVIRELHPNSTGKFYIAKPYCDAVKEYDNIIHFSDINGDGQFDNKFVEPTVSRFAHYLGFCQTKNGSPIDVISQDIIKEFDPNNPDGTDAGGPYVSYSQGYPTRTKYNLNNKFGGDGELGGSKKGTAELSNVLGLDQNSKKQEICDVFGIDENTCDKKDWAYSGGYWLIVEGPGVATGVLCPCVEPNKGCEDKF